MFINHSVFNMQAMLYSGSGNLLWVVEISPQTDVHADAKWASLSRQLCRDKFDGLMLVTDSAPYQAYFFNPDGSDGVFCGNGVRCVAYHLVQKYSPVQPFSIFIAGQEIFCQVLDDQVEIYLPKSGVKSIGLETVQVFPDVELSGFRMDMPNPHWVIFAEISRDELLRVGQRINDHYQDIYGGMNVEFVFKNVDDQWQALVYERGAGITEACGSGAMAVLCVLQDQGLIARGEPLDLKMSGGMLRLQDLGDHLSLRGQVQLQKVVQDAFRS